MVCVILSRVVSPYPNVILCPNFRSSTNQEGPTRKDASHSQERPVPPMFWPPCLNPWSPTPPTLEARIRQGLGARTRGWPSAESLSCCKMADYVEIWYVPVSRRFLKTDTAHFDVSSLVCFTLIKETNFKGTITHLAFLNQGNFISLTSIELEILLIYSYWMWSLLYFGYFIETLIKS